MPLVAPEVGPRYFAWDPGGMQTRTTVTLALTKPQIALLDEALNQYAESQGNRADAGYRPAYASARAAADLRRLLRSAV